MDTYISSFPNGETMDNTINEKMTRVVLTLTKNGSTYTLKDKDNATVNFAALYDLIDDESNYVVILYNQSKLRPQYVSANEIHCDGEDFDSDGVFFLRMLMTPTSLSYQRLDLANETDTDEMREDINNLNKDLSVLKNTLTENLIIDVPSTLVQTTGYYNNYGIFVTASNFWKAEIDVINGDYFLLTSNAYYNMARWVTLDTDGNVVRYFSESGEELKTDTEIIIEEGETKLIIQSISWFRTHVLLKKKSGIKLRDESVTYDSLSEELKETISGTPYKFVPVELDFTQYPNQSMKPADGFIAFDSYQTGSPYYVAKITVNKDEVYEIRGRHYYAAYAFVVTDENGAVIQYDSSGTGYDYPIHELITIKTGAKYMYIQSADLMYLRKKTGIPNYKYGNLSNKKIIFDGDSICESRMRPVAFNGGGYAKIVSDIINCDIQNYGVSGGRLITHEGSTANFHSISDTVTTLPTDGDLYIFEGGINDYWTNSTLGTFSESNYTDEIDATTVCGALETIFRYMINNLTDKRFCFIIVHKITNTSFTANTKGDTFEDYRNAMIGICKKYSVPYYDAWLESGLNGGITVQSEMYLTANASGTADGTHPNKEGYEKFYVPKLVAMIDSLLT